MEKHTIGGLRKSLTEEKDFRNIQDYFLTLSETNHQAMDGRLGKNKLLKMTIQATLSSLLDIEDPPMTKLMMIEVPKRYFWHGVGFTVNGYIFSFFYFADLDKGLVTLSLPRGQVLSARITIEIRTSPTDFSENLN